MRTIIDEARRHNITTFAHVFFLNDAIALVDAGIDVLAHSIRDALIESSFADAAARKGVVLVPTLVREEAEAAFSRKANPYIDDPLFRDCAGEHWDALRSMHFAADSAEADRMERKLETAMATSAS